MLLLLVCFGEEAAEEEEEAVESDPRLLDDDDEEEDEEAADLSSPRRVWGEIAKADESTALAPSVGEIIAVAVGTAAPSPFVCCS